jgi:hypothetical protein
MFSLAYYKFDDRNTGKLLQGILHLAQIEPPVQLGNIPDDIEIEPRLLEFQDDQGRPGYLFFAFNHSESNGSSESAQPFTFGLRIASGSYVVSDVVREQTVPATWSDGLLQLQTSLRPGEIWLVKILSTQSSALHNIPFKGE